MEIDITGPSGNAFALIGQAKTLAKQLDLDPTPIMAEMTSGNYENLLDVFEKYFSDYVQLVGREE